MEIDSESGRLVQKLGNIFLSFSACLLDLLVVKTPAAADAKTWMRLVGGGDEGQLIWM